MKTLTESIITDVKPLAPNAKHLLNELRLSKASTGSKLKIKSFEELEVGDMMYFAYIGQAYKFNFSGKIFKKRTEGANPIVYWNSGEKSRCASLVINKIEDYMTVLDGNFSDASGCVLNEKKDYWIYSTYPEYLEQKLKELFNLNVKSLEPPK